MLSLFSPVQGKITVWTCLYKGSFMKHFFNYKCVFDWLHVCFFTEVSQLVLEVKCFLNMIMNPPSKESLDVGHLYPRATSPHAHTVLINLESLHTDTHTCVCLHTADINTCINTHAVILHGWCKISSSVHPGVLGLFSVSHSLFWCPFFFYCLSFSSLLPFSP